MATVGEIRDFFNEKAAFYMKLDFDNVGLLVGRSNAEVHKVITALDITDEVIEEAISVGAQLIVSHHPLIFEAIKRVTDEEPKGRKILRMVEAGLAGICLHTNLDTADGGVNDCLMAALGCCNTALLSPHGTHPDGRPYGISRIGTMEQPVDFNVFLKTVQTNLNVNGLRYVDGGKKVHKIACCGGAGGSDMERAIAAGCDTYVTADLKYDHFLVAKESGLNLIDADHFCTENVVVPYIMQMLNERFPALDVIISQVHKQTIQFT